MNSLNEFELVLIETIIKDNLDKFSFLQNHLEFLNVETRKSNDFGVVVTFKYLKDFPEDEEFVNALLSAKSKLTIPRLKNELTYCLDITNSKIDFLDILTNEKELWDGNLNDAILTLEQS